MKINPVTTINLPNIGATITKNFETLCYIPSISNPNLNTILAIENEDINGAEKYYPCLICFDEDSDDTEITAKYKYQSAGGIQPPHQLLYLEDKHGIIYEYNGKIKMIHQISRS